MPKKVTYEKHQQTLDMETGEVIADEYTFETQTKTTSEPEFVKLYLKQWIETMGPSSENTTLTTNVLLAAIKLSLSFAGDEQGGQLVYFNMYNKKKVASDLGVSISTVNNAVTKLVKLTALKRVDRGVYQVNPYIMGKGSWEQIKAIQVTWSMGADGLSNSTAVLS